MIVTLQTHEAIMDQINNLSQYGVLGVFAIILIFTLTHIFKLYTTQMDKRLDQMQLEVNEEKVARRDLQKQFDNYIREDNKLVTQQLQENTHQLKEIGVALRENNNTLSLVNAKLKS